MVAVSLKKKKKKKKKKKNIIFFFFKQKTAYEMCDSDWSSDVCSSDLALADHRLGDASEQRLADWRPVANADDDGVAVIFVGRSADRLRGIACRRANRPRDTGRLERTAGSTLDAVALLKYRIVWHSTLSKFIDIYIFLTL